jgi:hypothetical protein
MINTIKYWKAHQQQISNQKAKDIYGDKVTIVETATPSYSWQSEDILEFKHIR